MIEIYFLHHWDQFCKNTTSPNKKEKMIKRIIFIFVLLLIVIFYICCPSESNIELDCLVTKIESNEKAFSSMIFNSENEPMIFYNHVEGSSSKVYKSIVKDDKKNPSKTFCSDVALIKPNIRRLEDNLMIYGVKAIENNVICLIKKVNSTPVIQEIKITQNDEISLVSILCLDDSVLLLWMGRNESESDFFLYTKKIEMRAIKSDEEIKITSGDKISIMGDYNPIKYFQAFNFNNDKIIIFFYKQTELCKGFLDIEDHAINEIEKEKTLEKLKDFSVVNLEDNKWLVCYTCVVIDENNDSCKKIFLLSCENKWTDKGSLCDDIDEIKYYTNKDPYLYNNEKTGEIWITWKSGKVGESFIRYGKIEINKNEFSRIKECLFKALENEKPLSVFLGVLSVFLGALSVFLGIYYKKNLEKFIKKLFKKRFY